MLRILAEIFKEVQLFRVAFRSLLINGNASFFGS